ncbi:MAG: glycosyltransferase family 2 protein [Minwuiales bacterium]|nr:glycosyltransferase family 2 protein [Minwuiales bacterium]
MSVPPVLSVVIPVYREAELVETAIVSVSAVLDRMDVGYEIVVVDDGSEDGTWAVLERLSTNTPALHCVSLARNFGKEAAILAGLDLALGDAVVLMDADLQHPPELIPEMFRFWRDEKVKVVNAVKSHRGREPIAATLAARLFYAVFDRLTGSKLAGHADFKLLDREVVDIYRRLPERNTFFRGLVGWLGFDQVDLPFEVSDRVSGRSRWSLLRLVRMAVRAIASFSTKPLHFVTGTGLLFFVAASVLAVQTLQRKLVGEAVEGFATVILLILFSSSVLMLSLGIVGQYLAQIYEEVKGRPRYLIQRRTPQPVAATDIAEAPSLEAKVAALEAAIKRSQAR